MPETKSKKFSRAPISAGPPPDLMKVAEETVLELFDALVPYLLAICGQLALVIPVLLVFVGGLFSFSLLASLGALGGGVMSDDSWSGPSMVVVALGSWVLPVAATLVVMAVLVVVLGPASASMVRAVSAHQRGGEPLTASSVFRTFTQDLLPVLLCSTVSMVLVLVGAMFCYFPGLVASAVAGLVLHRVAVDREPVGQAFARVLALAGAHPGWFLLYSAVLAIIGLVASNLPVLGQAFLLAYNVRVARQLFGDPPT